MPNTKTYTKGQRVTITRGQQRGATGTVHSQTGDQYVISVDPGRTVTSVLVKAPSLKAL